MIKCKYINPYKDKRRENKAEYSMYNGPYITTHGVKVPFIMTEFSTRRIITHHFHIDNSGGNTGIVYGMITGRNLMLKLGLKANFGRQILECDDSVVPMK